MTLSKSLMSRRADAPTEPASRVTWTRHQSDTCHPGWISDEAPSGIAFVTPTRERPEPGDQLMLTVGASGPVPQQRAVTVVHTSPYDRLFTLVGCREESGRVEDRNLNTRA